MSQDITQKTNKALKWSSITELLAKLITPVINMILARILAPEAFGVLATITMILSFADIFVEAGFQKFLIQHNFESQEQEQKYMSVAFWSNLVFSVLIWVCMIGFRNQIAMIAGNASLGKPIAIVGITIPLYAISGIQDCDLKKNLDFKGLFYVRIISAFVPLISTVPLALIGLDYWALILGNIAGAVVRVALLTYIGKFKPLLYYNIEDLKYMLGYGIWTLGDSMAVWLTSWIDTLLISHYMSEYYLGLYKNSISTITTLFAIVTSALNPVLFSSLSKLQDNPKEFNGLFLKIQKMLCVFLVPLGMGLLCYRDLLTSIMFGDAWGDAADIVGIMAITTALRTIFVSFYSDIYRAKGKFSIPLVLQLVDLAILIPICIFSIRQGFWILVYARAFIKLDLIPLEMILIWKICRISPKRTGKTVMPAFISTAIMVVVIGALQTISESLIWQITSIIIAGITYFCVLFMFKEERSLILDTLLTKIRKIKK